MNVLSLFDGIACGRVAFERAGIKVDKYYASEIDKYAIHIAMKNYPDIIHLGDINNYDKWDLPQIDIIIGGSPCQDLSIAKNDRQGLKGSRSGLFYKYVECLKKFKPKYFLLENNYSMPKESKNEITRLMGVEPIMINSALVSAQNRKRFYWTNMPNITQPNDKGIFLKDILQSGEAWNEKSYCLTASYNGAILYNTLERKQRTMIAEPVIIQRGHGYNAEGIKKDKSPCLSWEHNNFICEPIRLGQIGKGGQGQRIYSVTGKSICLSANGGGPGAKTGLYKIDLPDGDYLIRKLTPIECERLQTLPDNYTYGISNTQRYKAIGNGWTINVISHIFSFLPKNNQKYLVKTLDN